MEKSIYYQHVFSSFSVVFDLCRPRFFVRPISKSVSGGLQNESSGLLAEKKGWVVWWCGWGVGWGVHCSLASLQL